MHTQSLEQECAHVCIGRARNSAGLSRFFEHSKEQSAQYTQHPELIRAGILVPFEVTLVPC
jgi:hypothetical protein